MIFDEKLEQLEKGLKILNQFPESLQEKAFDYLFVNSVKPAEKNNPENTNQPLASLVSPSQPNNDTREKNNKYARVYTFDGEKVYLHKKIPGSNNATKTKNIALIVLYAKGGAIYGDEIKGLCEKQGCLDKPNFSSTFDADVKNFIKKGKKGSSKWTIELTMDGQEAAEALLEELLNANK